VECVRLYPPAWAIERDTIKAHEIGGYQIPAGSTVVLSQWLTHRDPNHWENPEGFDPERFSPERSGGRHRFAYFPFGGGPRLCVGNDFAMMEMTLVLATIAQRFHLALLSGHPVVMEPAITLRPKHGILTVLRPRATVENGAVRTAATIGSRD
jgi:cytochrome P450